MCEICDGTATPDDIRQRRTDKIEARGFALQGVESSPSTLGWAYTIGLIETYDHPELVVAGPELGQAGWVLEQVANQVRDGQRFTAGAITLVDGVPIGFRTVHPWQIERGLLAMWFDQYRAFDDVFELTALQVLLPEWMFCTEHGEQPRLDLPINVLDATPRRLHHDQRHRRRRR